MRHAHPVSPLARYIAVTYALLVLYACLYPFSGWRWTGVPLTDFLVAPFPRWFLWSDLVANVLGYIPLGFTLTSALPHTWTRSRTILVSTLLCVVLSFSVEMLQNFLPTRVASNVDLALNGLGGFLGSLAGGLWGSRVFSTRGLLHRWRVRRILPGPSGEMGLMLVGLWWFAQLAPGHHVFENGNVSAYFELLPQTTFSAHRFIGGEAIMIAAQTLATGLFVRCLLYRISPWPILLVLIIGIVLRAFATGVRYGNEYTLIWLTPGAVVGLIAGTVLLALAWRLPKYLLPRTCLLLLILAAVFSNFVPINPYQMDTLPNGNAVNFFGIAGWVNIVWPLFAGFFMALPSVQRATYQSRPNHLPL